MKNESKQKALDKKMKGKKHTCSYKDGECKYCGSPEHEEKEIEKDERDVKERK